MVTKSFVNLFRSCIRTSAVPDIENGELSGTSTSCVYSTEVVKLTTMLESRTVNLPSCSLES